MSLKTTNLTAFFKVLGFIIQYSLFTYYDDDCDLDMIYQILVLFHHLYNWLIFLLSVYAYTFYTVLCLLVLKSSKCIVVIPDDGHLGQNVLDHSKWVERSVSFDLFSLYTELQSRNVLQQ
jgi:hypothetical protein